ncbi:Similar to hypothetical protein RO3G_05779 [Rhizopus oryzae RA 99-880]; acc. no. EIE81074 [Pyronema omphalodes CBS 100304]|uniref:Protein kinase domain-containing protein n=1 Tax=Pyronema omphalodes (strain CBS 100304) TaxID=1076935 RepID=U4L4D8_PYROM|nr:Similar to hypothetical protein RO3G_05779 [Rhizopus oryzae RA 99-880]; acc. no. EIE81074 [Pyronema omphalodes CBS 100304]
MIESESPYLNMENWKQMWDAIPIDLQGKSYVGEWKQHPDKLFYEDRIIYSTITQLHTRHGHLLLTCTKWGSEIMTAAPALLALRRRPVTFFFTALAKLSRTPLHTKAFLYRDIAHRALVSLIRDTRLGTRLDRELKENERTGERPARRMELVVANPLGVLGDEDDENWEEEDDWDDEPEEMPEEELKSFFAACLTVDVHQRVTANELLKHEFLKKGYPLNSLA